MIEINKYLPLLSIFFILTLVYQVKIFKSNKPQSCLVAFKINNLTGFLIFLFTFFLTI